MSASAPRIGSCSRTRQPRIYGCRWNACCYASRGGFSAKEESRHAPLASKNSTGADAAFPSTSSTPIQRSCTVVTANGLTTSPTKATRHNTATHDNTATRHNTATCGGTATHPATTNHLNTATRPTTTTCRSAREQWRGRACRISRDTTQNAGQTQTFLSQMWKTHQHCRLHINRTDRRHHRNLSRTPE